MGERIVIESPAPPEAVLAAIREESREWRDSVVPPELRDELWYRLTARVEGARFRLTLASNLERVETVTLRGAVLPGSGGGSVVRGTFRGSSPVFWVVIGLSGALIFSADRAWGLALMGVGSLFASLDAWRGSRIELDHSAAAGFLAERLQAAVARAAAAPAAETFAHPTHR
jgi:hypothetical protein